MSLDSIKIPGNIIKVDGTRDQTSQIFMLAISTCRMARVINKVFVLIRSE